MSKDLVQIQYFDGANWIDITGLATDFKVDDYGITKVPTAAVNLHSDYTNLSALLSAHYKYFRILIKPFGASDFYRIFYGNIWNGPSTPELSNTVKMSMTLDCRSLLHRLTTDTISWDYYKLQSATLPLKAWSYQDIIDNMLLIPDSGYNTGIITNIPDGGNMDLAIDRSATFDRQTLLEAIRTICDRTGYDGYLELNVNQPTLYLNPFGEGSSVATLTHPFLDCKYDNGNLDDIINYILVKGGTDVGVPADGDRLTEKAVTKYSPPIWSIHVATGTSSLIDALNIDFDETEANYGVNDYCVKGTVNSSAVDMYLELNPFANSETGITYFDCKNRLSVLDFFAVPLLKTAALYVYLIDDTGKTIRWWHQPTAFGYLTTNQVYKLSIPVGPQEKVHDYGETYGNIWISQTSGSTTFNWDKVQKIRFLTSPLEQGSTRQWGLEIDGLQFVGGKEIDPFADYADIDNPPVKDGTSIAKYGVHIQHLNDTLISSFEQAQNEGDRVLTNVKNPIPTLDITIPALLSVVRPSNIVTVTVNQLGLSAQRMRVLQISYDWNARRQCVHQSLKLTAETNPLPPIWAVQPELKSFVK